MREKLLKIAKDFKDRTAYVAGKEKLLYGELFERAQKMADKIGSGETLPVAIIGKRKADFMAAILACLLTKRAYVPIDSTLPEERKNRIIKASKASLIIDCSKEEAVFEKLESENKGEEKNEIAYIIFTSGSTGEPKGVPISYNNLLNFVDWITKIEPLKNYEHAKVLNQAEFSFDLSTAAIYYSLFLGQTLVQVEDKSDFCAVFDTIKTNKTDVFVVTPTFLRLCLLNKDFNEHNFPFIKCIYFCGETLQKSLVNAIFERFSQIRIINAYGPTEATSAVSAIEITKEMLEHEEILPVGETATFATEIFIDGEEIVLKGKSVFSGYVGNPVGIGLENGYRTGDIGCIKNGKLYCKGRSDGQIKFKGYRIEILDIEENISSIGGVENAAVIVKKNFDGEVRMIKAYFSGSIDEEMLRKKLLEKIPEYMVPKIKKLEKLPVNKNGKIDRKELEKL